MAPRPVPRGAHSVVPAPVFVALAVFVAAAAFGTPASAQDQIFRCVDAKGDVHYGESELELPPECRQKAKQVELPMKPTDDPYGIPGAPFPQPSGQLPNANTGTATPPQPAKPPSPGGGLPDEGNPGVPPAAAQPSQPAYTYITGDLYRAPRSAYVVLPPRHWALALDSIQDPETQEGTFRAPADAGFAPVLSLSRVPFVESDTGKLAARLDATQAEMQAANPEATVVKSERRVIGNHPAGLWIWSGRIGGVAYDLAQVYVFLPTGTAVIVFQLPPASYPRYEALIDSVLASVQYDGPPFPEAKGAWRSARQAFFDNRTLVTALAALILLGGASVWIYREFA